MLKNYFRSAYRNIISNKLYSFINILGLSIGLICAIFISLFVRDELSYDKHNSKHKQIYRIESDFSIGGKRDLFAVSQIPMGPMLKNECPEVKQFARMFSADQQLIKVDDRQFYEGNIYIVDSQFFEIFDAEVIYGTLDRALVDANSIVVTKSLAEKYFGLIDPVGKMVQNGDRENFKITAVINDLPQNTHTRFDALISLNYIIEKFTKERFNSMRSENFWNVNMYTYLLLNENSSLLTLEERFPALYDKYMDSVGKMFNATYKPMFTNLADLHFNQTLGADQPVGNKSYVYIFAAIGIFILLIACINYMNMATARSMSRAREVGLRKVVGAYRSQLIGQFISEAVFISFIALAIALATVQMLLPVFNNLSGKNLDFSYINDFTHLGSFIGIAFFVGLLAGSYPAFYLSKFVPAEVLKGRSRTGGKTIMRKILVVFQFIIGTALIAGTIIVGRQLDYLKNKDLGYNRENVMVITARDTAFANKIEVFRREVSQNPNVLSTSTATGYAGDGGNNITVYRVEREEKMQDYSFFFMFIDYDYIESMGIEMVQGRNYDRAVTTDLTQGFIINQTAARELGWGDDAIGKRIQWRQRDDGTYMRDGKVIGVVKDFHIGPLHNAIVPYVMLLGEFPNQLVHVRIAENNKQETIGFIQSIWEKYEHSYPFEYFFLKERHNEAYRSEERISDIFMYFAILGLFIACLGLLGLSSFVAEQRTREVGIRKVMGASPMGIVGLLSREFIWLVSVAGLIAIPVAWYAMDIWLQNFAYHISLQWWYFGISFLFTLIIALLITAIKAYQTAQSNPVDTLKYE